MSTFTNRVMGHSKTIIPVGHRATHTYVVGQSGTGKSRALESWIMQDVIAGHGVGVIDPHGDLFRNLLYRFAAKPEIWDRIVILDPLDPKWILGFNPLEAVVHFHPERLALYMTDVCIKIWNLSATNAPRMVWLLTNSFLALSNLGLSLLDLPRFLVDQDFRNSLLPKISHETARAYFQHEFPKSIGAIHQWTTPVLNKIGSLIFDPDIRLMFAAQSTINFREIMDKKMILMVNLPKGILGEGSSSLLAAFIVAHIQKAALARVDRWERNSFYLYLDEFQNYSTDNIQDILSESRKYALSMTLAHQYLDQISGEVRSAVLNTAGTIVSFRVGYQDAYKLAKEIFPSPDFIKSIKTEFKLRQSHQMPMAFPTLEAKPLGWDGLALELANMQLRDFWFRKRGPYQPVKQHSFYMPDPKITPTLQAKVTALREISGHNFGLLKQDVADQLKRTNNKYQESADFLAWSD